MTKEKNEEKFKGVWIPRAIWIHEGLTFSEKGIWATIDSLGDEADPCRASNAWFAERFLTTQQTITNAICKLKKLGLVKDVSTGGQRLLLAIIPGPKPANPEVYQTKPLGLPSKTQRFTPPASPNKVEVKVENKENLVAAMAEVGRRVKTIFKREENDAWSYLEERYLFDVCQRINVVKEMGEIEKLYASPGRHFVSESASKLLENWTQMLDKARNPRNEINRNDPPSRNEGTHNNGDYSKYKHMEYGAGLHEGSSPDEPDQGVK